MRAKKATKKTSAAPKKAPLRLPAPPRPFTIPASYLAFVSNPYNGTAASYEGPYPMAGLRVGKRYAAIAIARVLD